MPNGAPLGMAPLLVFIEFCSHTAKALTLGLRLAANMIAGHLLFNIISGLT
jgi:F-type H+-transporting ATPase subunit a